MDNKPLDRVSPSDETTVSLELVGSELIPEGTAVMPADMTWKGLIKSAVESEVNGKPIKESVVERLVEIALEGNDSQSLKAMDMLFDRLDGRVGVIGQGDGDESPFQAWVKGLRAGEQMMIGVKKEKSE
tara:strand:+ start:118 stop:504 length:387 start_codon:yes stop_codon:yes gene_type:complete